MYGNFKTWQKYAYDNVHLEYLLKQRDCHHSIKDNFDLSDNINSKIIAFAFALAAEIERNLISQRTKEALVVRKIAGVRLGRPPGSSQKMLTVCKDIDKIDKLISDNIPLKKIAGQYGIHRNTLRRYMKMHKK